MVMKDNQEGDHRSTTNTISLWKKTKLVNTVWPIHWDWIHRDLGVVVFLRLEVVGGYSPFGRGT